MSNPSFSTHRDAALALLQSGTDLNRHCGGFLGQIAVDPSPLSERQAEWLCQLLTRAGLASNWEAANEAACSN
ncbi:hypothetical protein ACLB0R_01235 [Sphingomonas sp. GlSt437]|uniref:hypothetical protein n=1 Tax=Sphingomonas sp. GlSt437 TaxID=3389970 RepID=UPI003EC06724